MVTVSEICHYLEEVAPLHLAETWDNVGLLLGRSNRDVRRLMTCLTLTAAVAEEAIQEKCQMVVTHHPVLFRASKKITDSTEEGQLLLDLAEAGIAVHSPHTAFDSASNGINQMLATSFGLTEIQPLRKSVDAPALGAGRIGILLAPCPLETFLGQVADAVGAKYLEHASSGKGQVSRVGVACGSASEFLEDAALAGCDTFITGEARFHAVLQCQSKGINLILTGHFCSERPAVVSLANRISGHFSELHCFASKKDVNPLQLFQAPAKHSAD